MDFLGLPVEILHQIIWDLLPEGLESFAITCKALYAVSARHIERHNALKKRWNRTVRNSWGYCELLELLSEFVRDPLVPQYITSLVTNDGTNTYDEFLMWRDLQPGLPYYDFLGDKRAMQSVEALVKSSPVLEDAGVDPETWWQRILDEHRYYIREMDKRYYGDIEDDETKTATLLSVLFFLPNLKDLKFGIWWTASHDLGYDLADPTEWLEVLAALLTNANNCSIESPTMPQPLSKLSSLSPVLPLGYNSFAPLQSMRRFMALRNLETMHIVSCLGMGPDGPTCGFPFGFPRGGDFNISHHPPPSSSSSSPPNNLRALDLSHCILDASAIAEILSHAPQLTRLRYTHALKGPGCDMIWDAGAFFAAVARYGPRVSDLAVSIVNDLAEPIHGVGGDELLGFKRLAVLETDLRIFCVALHRPVVAPLLADILPDTLVELRLLVGDEGAVVVNRGVGVDGLLDGFGRRCRERLPMLGKSVMLVSDPLGEHSTKTVDMFDAEAVEEMKSRLWPDLPEQ